MLPDTLSASEVKQFTSTPSQKGGLPDTLSVDEVKSLGGKAVQSPTKENKQNNDIKIGGKTIVGGYLGGLLKNIGTQVKGNVKEASDSLTASSEGKMNPFQAGANIAQNVTSAVLSPINHTIGKAAGAILNPISEAIQNTQPVQKVTDALSKYPNVAGTTADILGTGLNVASMGVGGEAPTAIKSGIETTKGLLEKSPERQAQVNLKNASESIYPKLTPTEKSTIQLKDTGGLLKKSVPDLINDPKTKPVIEAVANLPDDIKIKPSDTVATKATKLNQGISRMHQATDNYLYEQTKTNGAKFSDRLYEDYMNEKVLKPVITEYGVDSAEAQAMRDNIQTGKSLIKNNDAYSVYKARQNFQGEMQRKYPNAFKKQPGSLGALLDPRANARLETARTFRTSLNDFISDELLTKNDPYRSRLKEESNLIRAAEEMRKRSNSQLDKNSFTRMLDRNPKTKGAINFAKGALKVGTGVDFINHL